MKKSVSITLIILACTCGVFAQNTEKEKELRTFVSDTVTGWKKGGVTTLSLAQSSFTNWASGGQNSISINGLISLFANYKKKNSRWDNTLDLGYGVLKQGKDAGFIKTDDKVDFTSKYGSKASKDLFYAALINFKTQMTPGYNYPNDSVKISNFLAPGYLLGAVGMDYKKNDRITVFLAPITAKITFVNDETLSNQGAFGVEPAVFDSLGTTVITPGKKSRSELGGYLRVMYKVNFFKDKSVSMQTKLELFSNYLKNPQNIDANWEAIISMKVNKYITATITANLIYDDDVLIGIDTDDDGTMDKKGPRTQFKEVIGVGFSYKF
jgi:hypothetical protein